MNDEYIDFKVKQTDRGLEFAIASRRFGVKRITDGMLWYGEGMGKHYTMLAKNDRFTIHETDESVPKWDLDHNLNLLALDLKRIKRRATYLSFQQAICERLRRLFREMRTPKQLQAQGVCFLMSFLTFETANVDLTGKVSVDPLSLIVPIPFDEPWEATVDLVLWGFDKNFRFVGYVLTDGLDNRKRVYLVRWNEVYPVSRWLLKELSIPDEMFAG